MPTEWKSCRVSQWQEYWLLSLWPFSVSLTTLCLHTWLDFQEHYLHWNILSPPHPSWLIMSWHQAEPIRSLRYLKCGIVTTSQSSKVDGMVTKPTVVSQPYSSTQVQNWKSWFAKQDREGCKPTEISRDERNEKEKDKRIRHVDWSI